MFSEPRTVYIFRCTANWRMFAATLEKKGTNLPKTSCSGGRWLFLESHRISDTTTGDIADDAMRASLASEGWYVWSRSVPASVIRPPGKVA